MDKWGILISGGVGQGALQSPDSTSTGQRLRCVKETTLDGWYKCEDPEEEETETATRTPAGETPPPKEKALRICLTIHIKCFCVNEQTSDFYGYEEDTDEGTLVIGNCEYEPPGARGFYYHEKEKSGFLPHGRISDVDFY